MSNLEDAMVSLKGAIEQADLSPGLRDKLNYLVTASAENPKMLARSNMDAQTMRGLLGSAVKMALQWARVGVGSISEAEYGQACQIVDDWMKL